MTKRRSLRTGVLDWWQTVIDETKSLVDDGIGRLRDDDDEQTLASEVAELKQSLAMLNAKLDSLGAGSSPGRASADPTRRRAEG
ncbi:MAG: hypothetical protein AB1679_18555 [Actinomycetota bacterium]